MSCFEFSLLSESEQVALLYEEGIYLGKRREKRRVVLLYQLDGFYVEIYYSSYRRLIHMMYANDTTDILDPYLDQIDVEYLVNE